MAAKGLEPLYKLLQAKNAEIQCAAAIVIGELGADDAGAVRGLLRALDSGPAMLKGYAVDALGKLGAREVGRASCRERV